MTENQLPVRRAGFCIDRSALDARRYVDSLFGEAVRLGLAGEADSERILAGVAELLREAIWVSSGGESTSVKEETAVRMTGSITYVIGIALMSRPTPEEAVADLLDKDTLSLYYEGLHTLNRMKEQADLLRMLLKRTEKPDKSQQYFRFIEETAPRYISEYEPKFDAEKKVLVDIPELEIDKTVHGMYELFMIMRRLLEYNKT